MNKIYIVVSILLITLVGCRVGGVRGNGNLVEETREVENFERVEVDGIFNLKIDVGNDPTVVVRAESNLMKYIVTKVRDNRLLITTKKNINPKDDLKVYISTKYLSSLEASGATDVKIVGLDSEKFYADLSGASDLIMEGKVGALKIDASGASEIEAKNLVANAVKIDASGASEIVIHALDVLDVDASGASSISYYGNPGKIRHDISGAGSLEKKGN